MLKNLNYQSFHLYSHFYIWIPIPIRRAIEEARGSTGRIQSNGIVPSTPRELLVPKPSPRLDCKLSPRDSRDRKGSITRGQMQPSLVSLSQEVVIPLAVNAAKGLIRAISLGTRKYSSSVAQDMLCKYFWIFMFRTFLSWLLCRVTFSFIRFLYIFSFCYHLFFILICSFF